MDATPNIGSIETRSGVTAIANALLAWMAWLLGSLPRRVAALFEPTTTATNRQRGGHRQQANESGEPQVRTIHVRPGIQGGGPARLPGASHIDLSGRMGDLSQKNGAATTPWIGNACAEPCRSRGPPGSRPHLPPPSVDDDSSVRGRVQRSAFSESAVHTRRAGQSRTR